MAGADQQRQIAVIVAAFNASATIERAVGSALAQPDVNEILVVDDASTDDTAARVRALAQDDARVRLIRQSQNGGPAKARNAALEAVQSPWIAILDADDYLAPGRFAAMLAAAGDCDFIADALIRTPDGARTPAFIPATQTPVAISFEHFVLGNMGALKGPLDLGFIKPLFRRAFVEQHQLRYADMRLGEDYEFYARALALGARFIMVGETGYFSVEREGSLSKDHSEEDLRRLRDCDQGLATIRPLSAAERRALARHTASVDCRLQWRRMISAVKARDVGGALSTFTSPQSTLYLAARLGEQAWARSIGKGMGRRAS